MKEHFIGLFHYNDWANQKLLICLQKNKIKDDKILTLFSHILAAEEIWLNRIINTSAEDVELWATHKLMDLINEAHEISSEWLNFLENYRMAKFDEVIAYTNSKNIPYESKLSDIIIHVANHGTHHRGQILTLLRNMDIVPPQLDYIFFCRDRR